MGLLKSSVGKFTVCGFLQLVCYSGFEHVEEKSARSLREFPLEPLTVIPKISYVDQLEAEATGALIFLHGSVNDGNGFRKKINHVLDKKSEFPHIRIIYPSAPLISYTPLQGIMIPTWYDISSYTDDGAENAAQMEAVIPDLKRIIEREVRAGIPRNRIAFAGFSRGGAMSLHMGYRIAPDLAGVGAMSTFLPENSLVYKSLSRKKSSNSSYPPLLQLHGKRDHRVKMSLGKSTFKKLQKYGISGHFFEYSDMHHELEEEEVIDLFDFIKRVIPY